jgi:MoaA/NifB/PqqE/SkfB family radical SAM enzyme
MGATSDTSAKLFTPKFIYVAQNRRCNLRCPSCTYWKLDDDERARYISRERKREILEEFAELSRVTEHDIASSERPATITCGGESMLDTEDYFFFTSTSRNLGLRSLSVTNGTLIKGPEMADRMILEGPTEVTISLNSHIPEIHDRSRGVKGAWKMAVRALRDLLEARKRLGAWTRIFAMATIHEDNWRDLDAFYAFALQDLGVDRLKLNMMRPAFGPSQPPDDWFSGMLVSDPDGLVREIEGCNQRWGLGLSPRWIAQVGMYFRSIVQNADAHRGWQATGGTTEHICNTYERNIMIDLFGNARLCFSGAFPATKLERRGDLRRFWESADPIREQMRSCNRYCGISHSVRRESATARDGRGAQAGTQAGTGRGQNRFVLVR